MPFYLTDIIEIFKKEGITRWMGIAVLVVVVVGLIGYYGFRTWKENPEIISQLPAKIAEVLIPKDAVEEEVVEEGEGEGETPEEFIQPEPEIVFPTEKIYVETAESGDGITHLARKALKEYLLENSQDFGVTSEHKVYVEDYLAREKGDDWLKLGEELEFSGDLLQEAIDKSKDLSPEQLENLTQYSQLIPSLNY